MLPTSDRVLADKGESIVSLDWETLGMSVRRRTLMAVASHFSEVASRGVQAVGAIAQAEACGSDEARGPGEWFVSES